MRFGSFLAALSLVCVSGAANASPDFWKFTWPETDFEKSSVEWGEIRSGGPGKDGIPALNGAQFVEVGQDQVLQPRESVIALEIEGAEPRAYPLRYLTWHEIVNDEVAGVPVAVTFCPLCNSAIVFDRRLNGDTLTLGVSGMLRNSDMVMFDRETESWWQQAIGEGIVGEHTGETLNQIPAWMESWDSFKARNPEGLVMTQPAGHLRRYGTNPYIGYDRSRRPFLYNGEMPPHGIEPLMRVVRVGDRAWPFDRFETGTSINEADVVISWAGEQSSALDNHMIGAGRPVAEIRVFDEDGKPLAHDVMFAFAFHAFWPEGEWMLGDQ